MIKFQFFACLCCCLDLLETKITREPLNYFKANSTYFNYFSSRIPGSHHVQGRLDKTKILLFEYFLKRRHFTSVELIDNLTPLMTLVLWLEDDDNKTHKMPKMPVTCCISASPVTFDSESTVEVVWSTRNSKSWAKILCSLWQRWRQCEIDFTEQRQSWQKPRTKALLWTLDLGRMFILGEL